MIEEGLPPVTGIVTLAALAAIQPLVRVFGAVTVITRRRRLAEVIIPMAVGTGCAPVRPEQPVSGFCLVIERRPGPVFGRVAGLALTPEATVMLVFIGMAAVACRRRLAVAFVRHMTVGAFRIDVRTGQREIREYVIENLRVQPDDIRITTFVVRMAGRAIFRSGVFRAAVISEPRTHVRLHALVTVQAQLPLSLPREGDMTVVTLGFEIGVAGDDFAGHHESFEIDGLRISRAVEQSQHAEQREYSVHTASTVGQYMCTASTCTTAENTIIMKNGT